MIWLRKRKPDETPKPNQNLAETVRKIQQGDESLRNELLKEYYPFILKTVSDVCKRYISDNDDEFSIGLLAFNDAIDKFDVKKGQGFVAFAKVVITNRLIDFIRTEQKKFTETTLDTSENEYEISNAEVDLSLNQYQEELLVEHLTEEIALYSEKLKQFGMTFEELTNISPKRIDARKNATQVAKLVVEDPELKDILLTKGQLPTKQILDKLDISRNTLERNRKYIIAIAVLLDSELNYLKQYLSV